jgi:FKBP-type peptidyl-prolyl cis-trans isomerase FkpA
MFNKFELIGAGFSVALMALAVYMVQAEAILFSGGPVGQVSQVIATDEDQSIVIVEQSDNVNQARTEAYLEAADNRGNFKSMVIDDVKIGAGAAVNVGDTVSVHYIGTLQNGQEFDNSHKRGQTFQFTVGAGQVIQGWDKGLVGMQVGGERILVIPPDMAYGSEGIGPIPGGATLVFAIELVEIK